MRFHRYLASHGSSGPALIEWTVSRVCEEFGCLPSAAITELDPDGDLDLDPQQVLVDVMELRGYARTYDAIQQARSNDEAPKGPMADLVWAIEEELHEERKARFAHGE